MTEFPVRRVEPVRNPLTLEHIPGTTKPLDSSITQAHKSFFFDLATWVVGSFGSQNKMFSLGRLIRHYICNDPND